MRSMPIDFGGSAKCLVCKGTGLDPHVQRTCGACHGKGWMTAEERQTYENRGRDPNPVIRASDRIVPIVQDNEFSREALDKAIRSGAAASKRRTILHDLHSIWPKGMATEQFEERYTWLHQSSSAALTSLHKEGLLSVIAWRDNKRGNREGVYTLSAIARGAWE